MSALVLRLFHRRGQAEPGVLVAYAIVLAALAVFVLVPVWAVLRYPGIADYADMLHSARWLRAARNSLVITCLSTASSTLLGFIFAFAVTRHDMPYRRWFRVAGMLPLFAPPFMVAFGFILMFGRRGLVSHALLGLDLNIFGWPGLWLSQTVAFFPLAMMILRGVLASIHPSTEQAALTLGATPGQALRTVVLPLVRMGLAGAALVVAITVLADFGSAVVIAGNYPILATEAWFLMSGLADLKGAAVVVAALLPPTVALFLLSRHVAKQGYVTVTGKGVATDQIPTPTGLKIAVLAVCGLASLLIMSVYAAIFAAGFVDNWGSSWAIGTRHWVDALSHGADLGRSIEVAVLAGLLTAVLGQLAAFLCTRAVPLRTALDFLAVLPGALPGVFVGVGFVLAFNAPPLELGGTIWIMVIALGIWHLPLAYQATSAALAQIHRSIEHAARDLGASELRLVWDVYAPLLMRSLVASFVQSFIRSVSNVSLVVFLVAPGNVVVTFIILQMIGGGDWGGAAALTSLLLAVTFCGIGAATWLEHRVLPRGAPA